MQNNEDLAPHHLSFIQPVQSSEHMAAFGVFGLCQIHAFVDYLRSKLNAQQFEVLFKSVISLVGFILLSVGAVLMLTGETLTFKRQNFIIVFLLSSSCSKLALDCTLLGHDLPFYFLPSGKISPWTGRFYSLLDPSYAKNNIPIIASVSEHQPTTWSSYYFDLQLLVFMFPGKCCLCWNMPIHYMFILHSSHCFFFRFLQLAFTTVSAICQMPESLSLCMVSPACISLLSWYVL